MMASRSVASSGKKGQKRQVGSWATAYGAVRVTEGNGKQTFVIVEAGQHLVRRKRFGDDDDVDARADAAWFAASTDAVPAFREFLFSDDLVAGGKGHCRAVDTQEKLRSYVCLRQNRGAGLRYAVVLSRLGNGELRSVSFSDQRYTKSSKEASRSTGDDEMLRKAITFCRSIAFRNWREQIAIEADSHYVTGHDAERSLKHPYAHACIDRGDRIDCSCGKNRSKGHMVLCESCGTLEHLECLGYRSEAQIQADYMCSACLRAQKEELIVVRLDEQEEYRLMWTDTRAREKGDDAVCYLCGCEDNEEFESMMPLCTCNGGTPAFAHPGCVSLVMDKPASPSAPCQICGKQVLSTGFDRYSKHGTSKRTLRRASNPDTKGVKRLRSSHSKGENETDLNLTHNKSDERKSSAAAELAKHEASRRFGDVASTVPIKKRRIQLMESAPSPSSAPTANANCMEIDENENEVHRDNRNGNGLQKSTVKSVSQRKAEVYEECLPRCTENRFEEEESPEFTEGGNLVNSLGQGEDGNDPPDNNQSRTHWDLNMKIEAWDQPSMGDSKEQSEPVEDVKKDSVGAPETTVFAEEDKVNILVEATDKKEDALQEVEDADMEKAVISSDKTEVVTAEKDDMKVEPEYKESFVEEDPFEEDEMDVNVAANEAKPATNETAADATPAPAPAPVPAPAPPADWAQDTVNEVEAEDVDYGDSDEERVDYGDEKAFIIQTDVDYDEEQGEIQESGRSGEFERDVNGADGNKDDGDGRKSSSDSGRVKTSGWDQLPDGFDKAEDALRAVKDLSRRPAGRATGVRPLAGSSARVPPSLDRFRYEDPAWSRHDHHDYSYDSDSSYYSRGRGKNGRGSMAVRRGDAWMSGTPGPPPPGQWGGTPKHHLSPPSRFTDVGFGPTNAAAAAAAKVESSGFVVAPDGTITRATSPRGGSGRPFARNSTPLMLNPNRGGGGGRGGGIGGMVPPGMRVGMGVPPGMRGPLVGNRGTMERHPHHPYSSGPALDRYPPPSSRPYPIDDKWDSRRGSAMRRRSRSTSLSPPLPSRNREQSPVGRSPVPAPPKLPLPPPPPRGQRSPPAGLKRLCDRRDAPSSGAVAAASTGGRYLETQQEYPSDRDNRQHETRISGWDLGPEDVGRVHQYHHHSFNKPQHYHQQHQQQHQRVSRFDELPDNSDNRRMEFDRNRRADNNDMDNNNRTSSSSAAAGRRDSGSSSSRPSLSYRDGEDIAPRRRRPPS